MGKKKASTLVISIFAIRPEGHLFYFMKHSVYSTLSGVNSSETNSESITLNIFLPFYKSPAFFMTGHISLNNQSGLLLRICLETV
jgi:hypothetical protein